MIVNVDTEFFNFKETKAGNYLIKVIADDGDVLTFFLDNIKDFVHLPKYSPLRVSLKVYKEKTGNLKYVLDSYHIYEDGELV